jgi:hypothetical protein
MENTIEHIDMKILPKEARRILLDFYIFLLERYTPKSNFDKKANAEESIIEDLLPKKVCNFVPLKREEIYGR